MLPERPRATLLVLFSVIVIALIPVLMAAAPAKATRLPRSPSNEGEQQ